MPDSDYTKRRERIVTQILAVWLSDPAMDWHEEAYIHAIDTSLKIADKLIKKLDEGETE